MSKRVGPQKEVQRREKACHVCGEETTDKAWLWYWIEKKPGVYGLKKMLVACHKGCIKEL
jgi:hypothetical protein